MKLIRKLFWIGVLVLPLFACDDPDTTVETEAKLQLNILLTSINLENSEGYSFSGFTTFCLANKDNAQNCPSNILEVMPGNGSILTLPSFSGEISSLQLIWGYGETGSDVFDMQNSIELLQSGTMSGNQDMSINLDEVLTPIISKIDSNPKSYIKIMVMGNAEHTISSMAKMEIQIIVEHEVLEVRFSVL